MAFKSLVKPLFILLFITAVIQTVKIDRPYLGHFASYQGTVMAAMARNMSRENFKEIHLPKTDLLISGKRSLHLNQYPFPSLLAALGQRAFGGSLEFWGRFQAILFNAASIVLIALIAAFLWGPFEGLIAGVLFAFSPFAVLYGQSFLSEASALAFLLAALYLALRHSATPSATALILSAVFFSLAVTGRIHQILFAPLLFFIFYAKNKKIAPLFAFFILSMLLPAAWYLHTYLAAKSADNVHTSLLQQLFASKEHTVSFFSLHYLIHLGKIFLRMLAAALPFLFFGFLRPRTNLNHWIPIMGFVIGFSVAILAPIKVLDHEFYLTGVFPFTVLLAASGLALFLQSRPALMKPKILLNLAFVYLLLSSFLFIRPLTKPAEGEAGIPEKAAQVRLLIPAESKIAIAGKNPAVFSYYVDRPSWPLSLKGGRNTLPPYLKNTRFAQVDPAEQAKLEEAMSDPVTWLEYLKSQGASYLVVPNKSELDDNPTLRTHLAQYKQLSQDTDSFYVASLI